MAMLERVLDRVANALLVFAAVIGFGLSFVVVLDVVGRVGFNSPLRGTPEIVASAIVVICWLQAAYAIRSGGMLHVDAFLLHMPNRLQAILAFVGSLLGILLFLIVLYGSFEQAIYAWQSSEYEGEGALRVPTWPGRFALVLGSALVALCYAILAIKQLRALVTGEAPEIAAVSH
jgi:TRAP-type C4-dicarboxylate transport system permease small subunit